VIIIFHSFVHSHWSLRYRLGRFFFFFLDDVSLSAVE
jgi:hypothetical protein